MESNSLDNSNYSIERIKLEETLKEIREQLHKKEEINKSYKTDVLETQKNMWENMKIGYDIDDFALSWQYQSDINSKAQKILHSNQLIFRLKKMLSSPYFGRIDFREKDDSAIEQIYVGIATLTDEDNDDILIYDWRSPIASMFYDYEIGKGEYTCPSCIVEGDILLKRQFKIFDGNLIYMFDTSLKIDDDILQEILSKSVNTKMKTIVSSIQREQNKAIRDDSHQLVLVNGPAGSGKTSIALHRIAYLLYRHRKEINSKNIVIFSPNEIFNDYISNVLPELGEENMNITTFNDYTEAMLSSRKTIEDINDQMEFILNAKDSLDYHTRIKRIEYLTSISFIDILKNYIHYLKTEAYTFEDIIYNNEIIATKDDLTNLYYKEYTFFPIVKRLKKIKNRLHYLVKPFKTKRYEELKQYLRDTRPDIINDEERKEVALRMLFDEFKPIVEKINDMTHFNLFNIYKQLFQNKVLLKKLSKGVMPDDFDDMLLNATNIIDNDFIYYEDTAPLLYLKGEVGELPNTSSIKYVVIDEVQDYTPLQFEIIKKLFPHSRTTLVGDLNQSINPYMNIGHYNKALEILDMNNVLQINLTKSYRSTKEITEFCNDILGYAIKTSNINRAGKAPDIIHAHSEELLLKMIAKHIGAYQKEGYRSIAIICKTYKKCENVYKQLKDSLVLSLLSKDDEHYTKGVVVVPSYLSKGLEFDAVLVYDADINSYYLEEDRRLFYTVCTRALHRLNLYYIGKLTPYIKDENPPFTKHTLF